MSAKETPSEFNMPRRYRDDIGPTEDSFFN
jgi:hypothetical protein